MSKNEKNNENELIEQNEKVQCVCCEEISLILAFCKECNGFLCQEGLNSHKKLKNFKTHEFKMNEEKKIKKIKENKKCLIHFEQKLEFFCETCSILVCPKCVFYEHKGHDCLEVTNENEKELIEKIKNEIKEKEKIIEDLKLIQNFNKNEEENFFNLLSFLKKIKEEIDENENEFEIEKKIKIINEFKKIEKNLKNNLKEKEIKIKKFKKFKEFEEWQFDIENELMINEFLKKEFELKMNINENQNENLSELKFK